MQIRTMVFCAAVLGFTNPVSAQTPWEEYVDLPTPENARKVQNATYSDSVADRWRLLDYDLGMLEVQVVAGDREAVRLAIRLQSEADGAYAEALDVMLGRLVRINPRLLLEELQRARDERLPVDRREFRGLLGGLLGNYGYAYVDRIQAHVYETERRIASLNGVTDPDLRQLRDSCMEILHRQLEDLRSRLEL